MNATTTEERDAVLELAPVPERLPAAQPQQSLAIASNSPAAMMLAAMNQGASLEQVEKMMDLQERWERREAEKAFRDAFAAFRGENIVVPKTKHVDRAGGGSFDQAEYHVAAGLLSPALARHGFGFRHDMKFGYRRRMDEGVEHDVPWVYVTCFLEHRAGHVERLDLEGPPGDLKVNTPVQNMQVTGSFLKRQSLLAITGTATGGEDDENAMRKRQEGAEASEHADKLRDAGRAAAMNGMAALTQWWGGLNSKDQAAMSKEFGSMRKAARAADEEKARG